MKQIKQWRKIVSLAAVVLMYQSMATAQTIIEPSFLWGKQLSGTGSLHLEGENDLMIKDLAQNIIITGGFDGTIDFDPGPGTMEMNSGELSSIFIYKSDSLGNYQWARQLKYDEVSPSTNHMFMVSTAVTDDIKGDIYLTGVYADTTIDFDPGPEVYHMTPYFNEMDGMYNPSVFILKLDANGNFKWAKSLDIYNGGSIHSSVVNSDVAGGLIYFTGFLTPLYDFEAGEILPLDFDPGPEAELLIPENYDQYSYMFTLNSDGEFQWAKPLVFPDPLTSSTSCLTIKRMEIDISGDIYAAGKVAGTIDLDGGAAVDLFTGNGSIALMKLSSDADIQWIKQGELGVNVEGGVERYSLVRMTSFYKNKEDLYISYEVNGKVSVENSIPFDGISTIDAIYASGIYTYANAVAKFGTDGTFKWLKQIAGADTANRVDIPRIAASGNNVYLTSRYRGSVDIDPGAGEKIVSGGRSFIAAFDSAGSFVWGKEIIDNSADSGLFIFPSNILAAYPNIYYSGVWISGMPDIDITDDEFVLTPIDENSISMYIAKIRLDEVDGTSTSADVLDILSVSVFPNPTEGRLQLQTNKYVKDGSILICDVSGKVLFSRGNLYGKQFNFDLSSLSPGLFTLKLYSGNTEIVYKLVKK